MPRAQNYVIAGLVVVAVVLAALFVAVPRVVEREFTTVTTVVTTVERQVTTVTTVERPPELTKVKVLTAWLPDPQFIDLYLARDLGFFREVGLDVELISGAQVPNKAKVLAAGTVDFANVGSSELIAARLEGVPIKSVGIHTRAAPVVFVSLKENDITKPEDFVGKNVGVRFGDDVEFVYRALIKKTLTPEQIATITEVPVGFSPEPLAAGVVDVYPYWATSAVMFAMTRAPVNMIYAWDYGVPTGTTPFAVTESMIRERPELIQKFLLAAYKGMKAAMNRGEDPFTEAQIETVILDISYITDRRVNLAVLAESRKMWTDPLVEQFGIGWQTADMWAAEIDQLYEYGAITSKPPVNELFTNEFTEAVHRQYGPIMP